MRVYSHQDTTDNITTHSVYFIDQLYGKGPCKYYNNKGCKNAERCSYLHMCMYALRGSCRNGAGCPLRHPRAGRESTGPSDPSASSGERKGRIYRMFYLKLLNFLSVSSAQAHCMCVRPKNGEPSSVAPFELILLFLKACILFSDSLHFSHLHIVLWSIIMGSDQSQ